MGIRIELQRLDADGRPTADPATPMEYAFQVETIAPNPMSPQGGAVIVLTCSSAQSAPKFFMSPHSLIDLAPGFQALNPDRSLHAKTMVLLGNKLVCTGNNLTASQTTTVTAQARSRVAGMFANPTILEDKSPTTAQELNAAKFVAEIFYPLRERLLGPAGQTMAPSLANDLEQAVLATLNMQAPEALQRIQLIHHLTERLLQASQHIDRAERSPLALENASRALNSLIDPATVQRLKQLPPKAQENIKQLQTLLTLELVLAKAQKLQAKFENLSEYQQSLIKQSQRGQIGQALGQLKNAVSQSAVLLRQMKSGQINPQQSPWAQVSQANEQLQQLVNAVDTKISSLANAEERAKVLDAHGPGPRTEGFRKARVKLSGVPTHEIESAIARGDDAHVQSLTRDSDHIQRRIDTATAQHQRLTEISDAITAAYQQAVMNSERMGGIIPTMLSSAYQAVTALEHLIEDALNNPDIDTTQADKDIAVRLQLLEEYLPNAAVRRFDATGQKQAGTDSAAKQLSASINAYDPTADAIQLIADHPICRGPDIPPLMTARLFNEILGRPANRAQADLSTRYAQMAHDFLPSIEYLCRLDERYQTEDYGVSAIQTMAAKLARLEAGMTALNTDQVALFSMADKQAFIVGSLQAFRAHAIAQTIIPRTAGYRQTLRRYAAIETAANAEAIAQDPMAFCDAVTDFIKLHYFRDLMTHDAPLELITHVTSEQCDLQYVKSCIELLAYQQRTLITAEETRVNYFLGNLGPALGLPSGIRNVYLQDLGGEEQEAFFNEQKTNITVELQRFHETCKSAMDDIRRDISNLRGQLRDLKRIKSGDITPAEQQRLSAKKTELQFSITASMASIDEKIHTEKARCAQVPHADILAFFEEYNSNAVFTELHTAGGLFEQCTNEVNTLNQTQLDDLSRLKRSPQLVKTARSLGGITIGKLDSDVQFSFEDLDTAELDMQTLPGSTSNFVAAVRTPEGDAITHAFQRDVIYIPTRNNMVPGTDRIKQTDKHLTPQQAARNIQVGVKQAEQLFEVGEGVTVSGDSAAALYATCLALQSRGCRNIRIEHTRLIQNWDMTNLRAAACHEIATNNSKSWWASKNSALPNSINEIEQPFNQSALNPGHCALEALREEQGIRPSVFVR